MEREVLKYKLATPESIKANQPGGSENKQRGVYGWYRYVKVLHRWHSRLESGTATQMEEDTVLLEALRAAPVLIERLPFHEQKERPPALVVYPKSFDALIECHKRDHLLAWLTEKYALLRLMLEQGIASDYGMTEEQVHALIGQCLTELEYQYRVLVLIVTHPEPGLPYNADTVGKPDVSSVPADIDVLEMVQIAQAFATVNAARLVHLRGLLSSNSKDGEGKPARPTWSIFFGSASIELKIKAEILMRDWSLISVLASVQLSNVAKQDAIEENGQKTE
jgi:hypothetical protein